VNLYLVSSLKMSVNKPPLSHMPLWNTQGQIYHILWGLVEALMKQH